MDMLQGKQTVFVLAVGGFMLLGFTSIVALAVIAVTHDGAVAGSIVQVLESLVTVIIAAAGPVITLFIHSSATSAPGTNGGQVTLPAPPIPMPVAGPPPAGQ